MGLARVSLRLKLRQEPEGRGAGRAPAISQERHQDPAGANPVIVPRGQGTS